jgi:hypothetical protein
MYYLHVNYYDTKNSLRFLFLRYVALGIQLMGIHIVAQTVKSRALYIHPSRWKI